MSSGKDGYIELRDLMRREIQWAEHMMLVFFLFACQFLFLDIACEVILRVYYPETK